MSIIVRPATRARGLVGTARSALGMLARLHRHRVISGLINILYLTGSFYMLEVYDRVLPSRSVPTLVALSILALTLFAFQGVLDVIRSRVMVRIAATLDERLSSARLTTSWCSCRCATRGAAATASRRCATSTRSASFLVTTGPLGAVRSAVDADLSR